MNLTGHALYDFNDEVHKQALTSVVRSLDKCLPLVVLGRQTSAAGRWPKCASGALVYPVGAGF